MLFDDLGRSGIFGLFIRRVPANLAFLSGEFQLICLRSGELWKSPDDLSLGRRLKKEKLNSVQKERALTWAPT